VRRTAALFAAAALLLSACSSAPSGAEGGDDGDALVVYSGRNEQLVGPLFEQFTSETGIEVDVRYGDTSGMAAQLLEEGDRTPADVFFSQDAGALGALSAEGLLAELPADTVAEVPEAYRAGDGTWTGVSGRARVLVVNPAAVPAAEVPVSVYELTDPKWAGRVGLAPSNASFQSFVTGMRVADGDAAAQQWLAGIAANDPQIFEKNGLILDAAEAGQIDIGLINHYYWFEKAAEVGEDAMASQLAYTEAGDPGSLVNVAGVGILAGSADDPDAAALLEFLLSPAAQEYFAEQTAEYPLVPGVPVRDGLVPLADLQGPEIDLADLADLAATVELIQDAGLL
jgi:iron(III) transport system substrate-binding protein